MYRSRFPSTKFLALKRTLQSKRYYLVFLYFLCAVSGKINQADQLIIKSNLSCSRKCFPNKEADFYLTSLYNTILHGPTKKDNFLGRKMALPTHTHETLKQTWTYFCVTGTVVLRIIIKA